MKHLKEKGKRITVLAKLEKNILERIDVQMLGNEGLCS